MNIMLIFAVLVIVFIIFIVAKKAFLIGAAGAAMYYSGKIASYLGITRIPFVDFDTELTNLVIAFTGYIFGFKYVVILVGVSFLVHFLHIEIMSAIGVFQMIFRGILIGGIASLFSTFSFAFVVPYTIIGTKVFFYLLNILFFGSSLVSTGTLYESVSIGLYLTIFRIFQ